MAKLYTFITGPNGAGKSEFLYSLGDEASWRYDETAGLEERHLVMDETLEVVLFAAVDGSRFDRLMQVPERDLLGYIVLVDSTAPETWDQARLMMLNSRGYALLPTVIAANKQDLPGAHPPEEVGAALGLESMVSVCECVATDPMTVRGVFLQLLYSVNAEIERLDALIAELERLAASGGE
ncbi:MAG TPA: ADP-ribosylation factor-like protein [Aggregatilineales bacterium]|nr:ADP-ribosylation factor-like protein [Aggregatilineales bacterium]